MRLVRLAAVILPLALGSAGCLRWLDPDYVCDDECFIGESTCMDDTTTGLCIIEPLFGCMEWVSSQDCGETNGVCIDAECTCSWGFTACGPDGTCMDTWQDPANCGACGVSCGDGEICLGGQCGPPGR